MAGAAHPAADVQQVLHLPLRGCHILYQPWSHCSGFQSCGQQPLRKVFEGSQPLSAVHYCAQHVGMRHLLGTAWLKQSTLHARMSLGPGMP